MSDRKFPPEDDPGPIYNPDSPYWHCMDFNALTEETFPNDLAFVCGTIAKWLASNGFATEWFPPDPLNVCPLPAWMIAEAYAALDPKGRPAVYWLAVMAARVEQVFGPPPDLDAKPSDDPDAALQDAHEAFEAFLRDRESET